MYAILQHAAAGLAPKLVHCATSLIRTPSPSLSERAVAELVREQMIMLGYDEVFTDAYGNVVGVMLGRSDKPVTLLASHLDTVSEHKDWKRPLFDAQLEDGRIYGLGAADCKGGLAAQIYAGALLKRSLLPLQGTLVVAATVAEENGLSLGFRHLLARTLPERHLKPDQIVLSEPTGLDICHGHDGWMDVSVQVSAVNQAVKASSVQRIIDELHESGHTAACCNSSTPEQPMAGRADLFCYHALREHEDHQSALVRLQHRLELATRGASDVQVSVQATEEYQPLYIGAVERVRRVVNAWSIDPYHPVVARARGALLAAGLNRVVRRWQLSRPYMGTAGSVAVAEFKIPTIGYGPGSEAQAHAPDESVAVVDLHSAMLGTALIAHAHIGIPVYGWTSDEP